MNNNPFSDAPESELVSSMTGPDVQLDLNKQTSDLYVLQSLTYLTMKPSAPLQDILNAIKQNPLDSPSHQKLESYLFNRYQATVQQYRQHLKSLSTYRQNVLTSQSDSCPNCTQYQEQLQRLQEDAAKPCMSCIQLKNAIKSVIQQISNTQTPTLDKTFVQQDLNHIFNYTFNTPANYESNNPELLSAQNNANQLSQQIKQLQLELQQTRDSLDLIQQTSNEYLNNVTLVTPARANTNSITELTEVAVVNAFNRATTLLQEKDQQITNLSLEIRKNPVQQQLPTTTAATPHASTQPNILRNYSPNSDSTVTQQLQSEQPSEKRLFYELLGQNLYELQTPSEENEYFNNYNTRAVTVRKSISDLLRETLQVMARTTGRADLQIESIPRAPPPYVRQQLTEQESHYLEEVERLGNLALAVRYCISSCIDRAGEQHPAIRASQAINQSQKQSNLPGNPTDLLTLQATAQKSLSQILKSLFNINLWPDHQSLKKSFGLLQSQELADQVARHCTNVPENFVDKQIIIDLSDVFHNLPRQSLTETLETLQNVIFEAATRTRLVPLNVADLAPIAIDLEEQNKDLRNKTEDINQENQTLKEIVKQSDDEKKDLLKQITTKDVEINKHITELKEQKNEIQQLQLENSRIPSLQEQIKTHLQKIEDISFKNTQLEQTNKNLEQITKKQEENLEKQGNQIQSQKELISNQQNRLDQFEMRYNDVVNERTSIMQKNRELVLLAKNLEQRINEQEADIIASKKVIGQEMPILQENVIALKKINTDLTNQLDELAEQKRKLFVTNKDQEAEIEQQKSKIKTLQTQFNEASESLAKTSAENKQIEEEINHLTHLFLEEQSKAKLLGDNLDKVSAQNVEFERQHVNDVAEVEKLRYDLNQNTILLEEANSKLISDQKELEKLAATNFQLTKEVTQNNERNTKNEAENQVLKTRLEKLEQEYERYQQRTSNEIAVKQKMLDDMTSNMTQLTYMTNNAEGAIGGLIKTQYNQEVQKYLDLQQEQFNAQIRRMDDDNNILVQELTATKQKARQLAKENKQLASDVAVYKEQLAKFQEVQEPLVAKTSKLLKSVNSLKEKSLFFVKTLERLSAAAGTQVQYYGSIERVLEGTTPTNDMTLTALAGTAATERKTRTADVLKLAEPTEDQLSTLCQLIHTGTKAPQKEKEIAELKKAIKTHEKTISELQEKIEALNKRLQEQYNKALDAANRATQQEHTIQMLTQNLNLSRQMLRDQNIEDTLGDIKERVSESFRRHTDDGKSNKSYGKPSSGHDIPSDSDAPASEFIADKPAMKSSNMHGTRTVQFQQNAQVQGPAIYEPSESVFGADAYNTSIANRYSSQTRAQPIIGLTDEEKGHIDRLLRENGDRVRGYSKPPSTTSGPEPVLPANVFVSKKQ